MPMQYPPIPELAEGNPWEKQPQETARSYGAFLIFLELPAENRTIKEADRRDRIAQGMPPDKPDGSRRSYIWSRRFRWVERAEAYDAWQDAKALAIHRRQRIRSATKHAQQAAAAADLAMEPIQKFRQRLQEALETTGRTLFDDMDDQTLWRIQRAAAGDLPMLQKAERDALASTADTSSADPVAIKARGEIVRKILANPSLIGLMEKVTVEITESRRPESA